MRIDRIKLINFRNFEKVTFEFPSNFTVVIGENGKGKSSILQGLRIAAATFFYGIDEADRYHIQKHDIRRIDLENRFVPQKNCSFTAHGVLDNQEIEWTRTISTPRGRTDYKQAYSLIDIATKLNDRVNEQLDDNVDLPVINYFSTARLWLGANQTFKLKKKGSKLKDGYARCIDDSSDKMSPMEWIKSGYWKKLKNKPESVLYDAVLEAIDTCIPNWTPSEWDEDSDDLGGMYTDENGIDSFIPLQYLSDGLTTMAGMVADIAYRCAVLNSHHGRHAVKRSKGVVLIDEIDMHLHPKWQQCVVTDLKKAFPNIQFIVTTHSPFIVQSLNAEELINLDAQSDEEPYKLGIAEVASHIMKVEPHSHRYQETFKTTLEYLQILDHAKVKHDAESVSKLDEIQRDTQVKDPGLAAFMEMNRLAKLGEKKEE